MKKITLFFCLILLCSHLKSQILDVMNPKFLGNVKSAHYTVYFDANNDDFAKNYDGEIVKEFIYSFKKTGEIDTINEVQTVGELPFNLKKKDGKIQNFSQQFNGEILAKGEILWQKNGYVINKNDIRKISENEIFSVDNLGKITKMVLTQKNNGEFGFQETKTVLWKDNQVEGFDSFKKYLSSHEECSVRFSDRKYDEKGNLIYYLMRDSCSATAERHEISIEYW